MKCAVIFLAFAALTVPVGAGTNRFTAQIIAKTEPSTNLSRVVWHPTSAFVSYLRPVGIKDKTTNFLFAYDLARGLETKLLEPPSVLSGTNKIRLSLSGYQWSRSGDGLLLTGDGDLWLVPFDLASRAAGSPRRLTHDPAAEELASFAPEGHRLAFVKTNNLFTIDVKSGRLTQLTFDGSELILNGKLDWVYGEEFSHVPNAGRGYEWSPDGRRIALLRLDDSPVPEYPLTDFLRPHPTLRRQRYPKSGDTNPMPGVFLVRADGSRPAPRGMPLPAGAEYVVPEFSWTPDSREVAVLTLNRAQNKLDVHLWDGTRQSPRFLLSESDKCWVNVFEPPRFLNDGKHFIWASERDGWYHCYLYQNDGGLLRQITRGPWQIEPEHSRGWNERPFEFDPADKWLYFSATEKDARERHLYRIGLDSGVNPSRPERLTREEGTHFQKPSPDGKYLLETFSAIDQPPAIRILHADGSRVATLEHRADRWGDYATASFEFHELRAPDGTKLHGQLIKPAGFDPAKKYPVVVYVYGGPHAQVVRNLWPPISARHQLLAQEGFLIWSLDNRGSWGRGHAWESAIYRNCGTNELADQLVGVAYLKTLPFVETNRFGIWGWSYGGYMTLYALTHAPDVFRCGVAGAPVTDWKFYDTIYTERYMRTPKENPDGYQTSSPLAAAAKLKARLLLIHGTADDNVHMQNTMNFLDALVKAGRPYELQIQPGQSHGFSGEASTRFVAEQLVDFFKRNL